MFIIIFFLALELKTQKPSGSQPVHLIAPRYELGYHRPEELGPFLANYVERRFGETSQKRRAPEGGGEEGVFLLEVQYSILKSLISTCVLSYVGSREYRLLKRGLVTWPNQRVIKRRISYPYQ